MLSYVEMYERNKMNDDLIQSPIAYFHQVVDAYAYEQSVIGVFNQ